MFGFFSFSDLDLRTSSDVWTLGFTGSWMLAFSDVGHSAFRILNLVLLFVRILIFSELDCFRLLIQRWKNVTGWGNLFDKGGVWPDESARAPGEGYD